MQHTPWQHHGWNLQELMWLRVLRVAKAFLNVFLHACELLIAAPILGYHHYI